MEDKSELQIPPGVLNRPRGLAQGLAEHLGQICEQAPGQAPSRTRAGSWGRGQASAQLCRHSLGAHKAWRSEQNQDFSSSLPWVRSQHAQLLSEGC